MSYLSNHCLEGISELPVSGHLLANLRMASSLPYFVALMKKEIVPFYLDCAKIDCVTHGIMCVSRGVAFTEKTQGCSACHVYRCELY